MDLALRLAALETEMAEDDTISIDVEKSAKEVSCTNEGTSANFISHTYPVEDSETDVFPCERKECKSTPFTCLGSLL